MVSTYGIIVSLSLYFLKVLGTKREIQTTDFALEIQTIDFSLKCLKAQKGFVYLSVSVRELRISVKTGKVTGIGLKSICSLTALCALPLKIQWEDLALQKSFSL